MKVKWDKYAKNYFYSPSGISAFITQGISQRNVLVQIRQIQNLI